MIDFSFDLLKIHKQKFRLYSGEHRVYIECSDETGDNVRKEHVFELIHDESPPLIARVYVKDNRLKLITTENSECVYSTDQVGGCGFSFSQANSMGSGKKHSTNAKKGKTYYIKCKDESGNSPGGCSIIVQPS